MHVLLELIEVLVMHALEVAERGDAGRQDVAAPKQMVAIDKVIRVEASHQFVAAGDLVAGRQQRVDRLAHPAAFDRPAGDGRRDTQLFDLASDERVVRQLHLVDRDVVGLELFHLLDAVGPIVVRLADHAGDQVDVDLRKADLLEPVVGSENLRREMGPAVVFEDLVVEILDAERDAGHADLFEHFHLFEAERSRLALEGDFLGRFPGEIFAQPIVQRAELLRAEIRRRAAAEVSKPQRSPLNARLVAQQFEFVLERLDIILDRLRVLIRVNAEVTEPAPFAAKGDVNVQPHRHRTVRLARQSTANLRDVLRLPQRKRRVIGDEITTDVGRGLCNHGPYLAQPSFPAPGPVPRAPRCDNLAILGDQCRLGQSTAVQSSWRAAGAGTHGKPWVRPVLSLRLAARTAGWRRLSAASTRPMIKHASQFA